MEKFAAFSDDKLVDLYKEGNYEAFDALLTRHQERIFQYIHFMVSGNKDKANDVFQDTFVKAIMAIREGRYHQNGQFVAWMLRIARNIVLDAQRSQKASLTVNHELTNSEGEVTGDLLNNNALCEPNIEMEMIFNQSLDDVRMMVDLLPENQREVVVLRYYQDLSFKEIAELTNVGINTALGRMHYAMINLRRMAQHRNLYLAG